MFFDAARTGACGACHELNGWGAAVGPDLGVIGRERLSDLRWVTEHRVKTARPTDGEAAFPALLVEQSERVIRVYDLTARLPVLRSFAAGRVALDYGSSWRHADAVRIYNDPELAKIAGYLRSIATR